MVSQVGANMQQTPAVEQVFARSMISRWGPSGNQALVAFTKQAMFSPS